MASLSQWVREILLVVLMGWLLEAFLPAEGFQRYLRLVVGLLVVVAVIAPALTWLKAPSLPALPAGNPFPFLSGGAAEAEQAAVWQAFRRNVEATATAMALAVPGVAKARATVAWPNPGGGETLQVTRVTVAVSGPQGSLPSAAVLDAVRRAVAQGLSLPPSAVTVTGGS